MGDSLSDPSHVPITSRSVPSAKQQNEEKGVASSLSFWERYNPKVSKHWHFLVSGGIWLGVGIMLLSFAYSWLQGIELWLSALIAGGSLLIGLLTYKFMFQHLAFKNIHRLRGLNDKACFFSFQPWKNYLIVVSMIAMGITLRHSSIPKQYLAIVYITMGLALFLGSFHYFASVIKRNLN